MLFGTVGRYLPGARPSPHRNEGPAARRRDVRSDNSVVGRYRRAKLPEHLPHPPSWTCTGCGREWPCATKQSQLLAEFGGARAASRCISAPASSPPPRTCPRSRCPGSGCDSWLAAPRPDLTGPPDCRGPLCRREIDAMECVPRAAPGRTPMTPAPSPAGTRALVASVLVGVLVAALPVAPVTAAPGHPLRWRRSRRRPGTARFPRTWWATRPFPPTPMPTRSGRASGGDPRRQRW
ncbi:hypothetical protein NKG94_14080 [Micromonospora sp. M12]